MIDGAHRVLIQEVIDDVALGALAVELEPHDVVLAQMRSDPLCAVDESATLEIAREGLFGEHAGTDLARIVQSHGRVARPPAGRDHLEARIADRPQSRETRGSW